MSGDVQPRKRKDKKRKKDELGVEEPRGTAAVLGEGDVFMHSQNEHGTGGHWCAKIIFFSLLAILITLIGLIILENRGLTELEANAVETRYSGVLQGWLEDSPDDDHHDEHTLDLKHQEDDDEIDQNENNLRNAFDQETEHGNDDVGDQSHEEDEDENEQDNNLSEDDDENNGDSHGDDDENNGDSHEDDDENNGDSHEGGEDDVLDNDDDNNKEEDNAFDGFDEDSKEYETNYDKSEENDEDIPDKYVNKEHYKITEYDDDIDEDINNEQVINNSEEKNNMQTEFNYDSIEKDQSEINDEDLEYRQTHENEDISQKISHIRRYIESDEDFATGDQDSDVEIEKIEKEYSDEESNETPIQLPVAPIKKDFNKNEKSSENHSEEEDDDDTEFLSPEDIAELPIVEPITAPRGKPFIELEDETSTEKPPNTLAEEEQYEKQQAELNRQKEQASHMWLKVVVGCALLVATHGVVRRATASRDVLSNEEHDVREETPTLIDRRMTLILEESVPVNPTKLIEETSQKYIAETTKHIDFATKMTPVLKQVIDIKEDSPQDVEELASTETIKDEEVDKELYSDEDDEDVQEELLEEKTNLSKQPVTGVKTESALESDLEEVSDDVEIIDDEQFEEELIDEDEEEISDVDDSELLRRLEAKYGRLPEPERPGPKPKEGGNNVVDEWPGEPSEAYWRQYLDHAEHDLQQGKWSAVAERVSAGELRDSARARLLRARALDAAAEARRDNALLSKAIAAYLELLKMNERLSDHRLKEIAERTLDRIRFRGNYMGAEPVYKLLIKRFPDDPSYRNNLSISFLMANRPDLAEDVLKDTLQRWPKDRVALAHLGFVLKTRHNRLSEAVDLLQEALEGDIGPANESRFYYHLGDALLLLGRYEEANKVHVRGAKLGHFLSPSQRSLYNVERLKSRPWWNLQETPYIKLVRSLEKSWKEILKEGNAAKASYEKEKEGLKERGEWSQLDLFVRGQEIPDRCKRAPVTCSIVRQEAAAAGCRRGQIKFSMMEPGTHVRPHVGPTNCRLRMHLALSNTKDTFIRVDQEIRQWETGKVFMFDDSFEHEVWHNGTGTRLVLIVDVWHPDLTPAERKQLPSI